MNLFAKLSLDGSDFVRGLAVASSKAKAFGKEIGGGMLTDIKSKFSSAFGFAAVAGGLVAFGKHVMDTADHIGDLADQLGLTTEEVQRLQVAAGRNGLGEEDVFKAVSKISQQRTAALGGDAKANALFRQYAAGLRLNDATISNLDLAKAVMESASKSGNWAQVQADLFELAGKKGARLVSTFDALKNLGPIKLIRDEDIAALGKAKDQWAEAMRQATILGAPAVGEAGRKLSTVNAMPSGLMKLLSAFVELTPMGIRNSLFRMNAPAAPEMLGPPPPLPDLKPPGGTKIPKEASLLTPGDSLAKMGLFVGGAGNPVTSANHTKISLLRQSVAQLHQMNQHLSSANRQRP